MKTVVEAQKVALGVGVVVNIDAVVPAVDGLDVEDWPTASAPGTLLRRLFGRCWMTWLTWHLEGALRTSVVEPRPETRQRSRSEC